MNTKYTEHFLMKLEDVKKYAAEVICFFGPEAELTVSEIGDGNINYVFRVSEKATGRSLVIKQADKVLRASGRPLDLHRNKIEAEILKIQGELAPDYVPRVYRYDEIMCALSMEDISAYKNLRKEMLLGKTFPCLAEDISSFLVDTLLPTTDLVMDRGLKKEWVKLFTNVELCDISEDLVFTQPYYDLKGRNCNIVTPGNEVFVESCLYSDEELKGEVGKLRDDFMNHAQALIHGDLHSGSIFVNNEGTKVIDPEFAFYGPMGYDIGNVIGNLFFAWTNRVYLEPENSGFLKWIEETIIQCYDMVRDKIEKKYDEVVSFDMYRNSGFKDHYIRKIMADTLGYAGTEIIRRVVGDSKVEEVSGVENAEKRLEIERALILTGIVLIKQREKLSQGKEIAHRFHEIIEHQVSGKM
ncbi:MAG: S-methyl-5-thioribose kinase [Hungatella sp.]|jgi:5-methylthioribose kinase|nr:S-methyl-5-thioribose kinase [Hungatella sp.]